MTSIAAVPAAPGDGYERADLRTVVDIDHDLPRHDGRWANESWFVVANLDAAGQRLGFQVHVLPEDLPQHGPVVSLNVVIVNETAGWSRSFEYVHPLGQITISSERFEIVTPEIRLAGDRHHYGSSKDKDETRRELILI